MVGIKIGNNRVYEGRYINQGQKDGCINVCTRAHRLQFTLNRHMLLKSVMHTFPMDILGSTHQQKHYLSNFISS